MSDVSALPARQSAGLLPARLRTEPESVGDDLARFVLTIVELVRQLMERQAIRRVEAGNLSEDTIERLGLGLLRLEDAMAQLCEHFQVRPEELNLDLGPLGQLLDHDHPRPPS